MKKLLLLPIYLTIVFVKAQSSAYHPLPDSGAMWNFSATGMCWWGSPTDFYSVVIPGDTLINATVYHQLHIPAVQHMNSCPIMMPGYQGAFRNDTAARKVYFVPPSDSVEWLLYDFNLHAGDTVAGWLGHFTSPSLVDHVDSVLVNHTYRQRFVLDCYNVSIIEGVGSTYGLVIPAPGCWAVDLPDFSLDCFSINHFSVYPDTSTSCQLIDRIPSDPGLPQTVKVLPNPTTGPFRLMAPIDGAARVSVRNTSGCLWMNKEIEFESGYSEEILLNEVSPGIYFIELSSMGMHAVSKLIVN